VAYNLRWIFENLQRDFNYNPKKIRAIGGGSVNNAWMQGIADITGKTVETTGQPTLAGALGAATCAFVGSGRFKDFAEMNRYIRVKEIFSPNPGVSHTYQSLFRTYKNVYSGLKKAYIDANLSRFAQEQGDTRKK